MNEQIMRRTICLLTVLFGLFFSLQTFAQDEKDTPQKGEGISAFLRRNDREGKDYYKEFLELNKRKLRGKEEVQLGVEYLLPPLREDSKLGKTSKKKVKAKVEDDDVEDSRSSKSSVSKSKSRSQKTSINEPLFGSALANVKVTSDRLRGACFYVVSGHGGPDPGAIGMRNGVELHEDEYAYDVILRLARLLMQEGAQVNIIIQDAEDGIRDDLYLPNSKRETCMGDPIPLNQVQRLQQRCDKINELYRKDRKNYKYCRSIFLHVDSRSEGMQTDVFFYYSQTKPDSKRLATTMQETFESKYGKYQPNRGFCGTVGPRNLYVIANSSPSAVFVELGNIQNSSDQQRFILNSNRQALATWLRDGFVKDYKDYKSRK